MWSKISGVGKAGFSSMANGAAARPECRRAYYRVAGVLPIRLTPVAAEDLETAIFELSLPDPLLQPRGEGEESGPLMERLRRIEEKLDLLLGESPVQVPRRLAAEDRQSLVFSGSGLALDVAWAFRKGDAYRVEMELPPPYSRTVRAVGVAVKEAASEVRECGRRSLALAFQHMPDDDRDAVVAYTYDLQRIALRSRCEE
jgi:hypothetical protein